MSAAPSLLPPPLRLDDQTLVFVLELPPARVVLFQAHFELYEGVATIRTVSPRDSVVCVLTTPAMLDDCRQVLDSVRESLQWRAAANPEAFLAQGQ